MLARLSVGFVLVFAGVAPTALAIRLTPGDLLVLDASNQKILHVDVATGAVDDFAPRGGGSNLIDIPRGIASSPEGEVYVTNYVDGTLVRIDAASGAQSVLEFFASGVGGPLDLGTHPAGVAVSPAAPAANSSRDVYVSSQGAMYRVQQDLFSTMSERVAYPLGYETTDGMYLSAFASGVVQAYIFAAPSVLAFNGSTIDTFVSTIQGSIQGLEWVPFAPFLSRVAATCPSSLNGVATVSYDSILFRYTAQDYATGGDLSCPGALTATPPDMLPFAFYVIDEGSDPPRILRFESAGAPPATSLVATLPAAAIYPDMAVYAPEPGAASTGGIALLGLTALGARLRWRRSLTRSTTRAVPHAPCGSMLSAPGDSRARSCSEEDGHVGERISTCL